MSAEVITDADIEQELKTRFANQLMQAMDDPEKLIALSKEFNVVRKSAHDLLERIAAKQEQIDELTHECEQDCEALKTIIGHHATKKRKVAETVGVERSPLPRPEKPKRARSGVPDKYAATFEHSLANKTLRSRYGAQTNVAVPVYVSFMIVLVQKLTGKTGPVSMNAAYLNQLFEEKRVPRFMFGCTFDRAFLEHRYITFKGALTNSFRPHFISKVEGEHSYDITDDRFARAVMPLVDEALSRIPQ